MDSMDKLAQYGKIGLFTHLALSWTFLFGTYLVIQRTGKPGALIKRLKLESKIPEKAGSFVTAGIIYKAVMPFRLALSLMVIPVVCNAIGEDPKVEATEAEAKPEEV